ncbi:DUF6292 family protein [Amycolatopsis carbonis]|uniref:DUF6292 family protein n=1 Tax=Amycolatopsis carbonis TaxID=715471 RepID=A0A9Y2MXW3_9PSEU|nr:DUF6292 family protein [Amycolatopsis sp. 2-15]WIX82781.1 DUF6292 family protein [Amycolatopsis sp. 2-15]
MEPEYREGLVLRHYVDAVAEQVGVEAGAALCESGPRPSAYIALADSCSAWPERLLMLLWNGDEGWRLALEPDGPEEPVIIATWPRPLRPAPARVARRLRDALRDSAEVVAPAGDSA